MTNIFFILYDTEKGTSLTIRGYEEYLNFFRSVLLPSGLGTRYLYSEVKRGVQKYHYRIVHEQPGYIGYVRNRLAPKRNGNI